MTILTKLILVSCFLCILNLAESKTLRNKKYQVDQRIEDAVRDLDSNNISGFKVLSSGFQDQIELVETYSTDQDIYEMIQTQDQDNSSIFMVKAENVKLIICYIPLGDKAKTRMTYTDICNKFKTKFQTPALYFDEFDQLQKENIISQIP